MVSDLFKNNNNFLRIFFVLLLITLLTSLLFLEVAAEHKEFEVKKFEDNFGIPANNFKTIDFNIDKGKEIEIVYKIQVQQDFPIDIWFVNEDNYLLLSRGAQFLYYIDGTEQKISYTKKVVTLTEHDNYKLIMTNYYSNQTVDVEVTGEVRDYQVKSDEESLNYSSILLYSLIIIIIVFTILLIFMGLKIRRYKQAEANDINSGSTKKNKTNKSKKNKIKNKSKDSGKKGIDKKLKLARAVNTVKKNKKSITVSNSHSYCGFCGKSVSTPYCKHCGRKV